MTILSNLFVLLFKLAGAAESLFHHQIDIAHIKPHWRDLPGEVQCVGQNVRIDTSVRIESAPGLAIGNEVVVGAGTYIDAQAGLILCDQVQVGEASVILTSLPLPPNVADAHLSDDRMWGEVFIGPGVRVGSRACILPGVTIGEGAEIAPGAVVMRDVAARQRVGFLTPGNPGLAPVQVRSEAESQVPVTSPGAAPPVTGRVRKPDITFVATTGRSGSMAIVDLLGQHHGIVARHEPRQQLIKLSTDYAHGLIPREEARTSLERLFLDGTVYHPDRIYLESDQKYFNLIPILHDILPEARFIWLIRAAHQVVASTYSRSWYSDSSHPVWSEITWFYQKHRIAGDRCLAMSAEAWAAMSPFERNCWYWAYVNETIERDLALVPRERQMFLRLEDLGSRVDELVGFLGGDAETLSIKRSNKAFYKKIEPNEWTPQQCEAFERICGPMMRKKYG